MHADVMMLRTELMQEISGVPMPNPEFILVDDYWYSFVLGYHLGGLMIKL